MSPTPSQTVGPFFGFGLPFEGGGQAVPQGAPGAIRIEGRVIDGAGEPVQDALLEFSSANQFARCRTDSEGAFDLTVRKPALFTDRDGSKPAPHLDVTLFARGLLRHLATRLYFPDEADANNADPVLQVVDAARRSTLVAQAGSGGLRFDIHLQGDHETVFFAL